MIFLESNAWMKTRMKCTKCAWRGTMGEVHTTRGGHDFVCPTCGKSVTEDKNYPKK